ncbi:MAG TPA: hypothetical protein VF382_08310 [Actinomycetota bacterium]
MPEVHAVVGFALLTLFAIGWMWGLALRRGNREAGESYWGWVTVVDAAVVVQAFIGMTLLLLDFRPRSWQHLVYGFGPLVVVAMAHGAARLRRRVAEGIRGQEVPKPWAPFAWAAFFNFLLTLGALMTGFEKG